MMCPRVCLVALSLIATLIFASCHFSAQDDLAEYLDNGGVRLQKGDSTSYRQLKPVKLFAINGSAELIVKDGDIFEESPQPVILRAPTETVADNVTGIKNALILYKISYCAPGETQFEVIEENTTGVESSVNGSLKTGYYLIEAFARKTGYIDSQATIWNLAVGREIIVTFNIKFNNYIFEYNLITPLFSRENYDAYHTMKIGVKVYEYDDANGTKTIIEKPSDASAPIVWLLDKDTSYKLEEENSTSDTMYNFVLPEQLKGDGAEPTVYGLRIQMTYNDASVSETTANAITIVQ